MNTPTFAHPLWFAALALIPLLAVCYALGEKKSVRRLTQLIAPKLRDNLLRGVHRGKRLFRFILTLLALGALIVTLARPQWGFESQEITRKGRDIVVAVDTSRSMLADDVTPNRLARAKLAVQDLLRILEGDRVALVPFAGSAFLQAPLTIDYGAVQDSLDELDTTIIPKGGTNLAEAIATSLEAFGKAEGAHKAIVLFTDGEELTADAVKAATNAKAAGVRIFTVGVGSSDGAMIPIEEEGTSTFVRDDSGQFVKTRLDSARLKEIADLTGGFYVQLENNSNAVQTLIDQGIRQLEMQEGTQLTSRRPIERYQWPLGLAIVLFLLAHSLSDRRRTPALAVFVAALLAAQPTQADSRGLQLYEQGKFPEAMTAFQLEQKRSPNSPERNFNTGTAAYKAQRYNDALVAFGKASTSSNPQLRKRAEYNAANTLFQRGAANEDHGKKIADWKEALLHYDEALKIDPEYADAKINREIVEKLLKEDEEKKQEQEKRDEEEKKEQDQQQQQQQQNQQQQQQGKQDPKDQKPQDQKGDQKGEQEQQSNSGKSDPKQSEQPPQSGQDQQQRQANQGKNEQEPEPAPTPGEKKEGELKAATDGEDQKDQPNPEEGQQAQAAPAEEREGEMSQEQARALIEAMQGEEERVNLRQQRNEAPVAKDW